VDIKKCFKVSQFSNWQSTALLLIRLVAGLAFMLHGWGKIQSPFSWMPPEAPIPGFLQFLAAFAEFGGGLAWILGLLTPLASLGIAITMLVATMMHAFAFGDPFVASGPGQGSFEPALNYLVLSLMFMAMGPGKFSIDQKIFGKK
jgi:putative oxidoreductase